MGDVIHNAPLVRGAVLLSPTSIGAAGIAAAAAFLCAPDWIAPFFDHLLTAGVSDRTPSRFLVLAGAVSPAIDFEARNRQLREANERLSREVAAHETTLRELQAVRRELERRVADRTKELTLIKAQYETALRGSHVTVFTQDADLRYTAVTNPFLGRSVEEFLGRSDEEVLPDENRSTILALKHRAREAGAAQKRDVRLRDGETDRWFDFHVEALRDARGETIGLTSAAIEVTERKESEAQLRLLMRELTHRSKNLLAVIQAMARQTARSATSIERFIEQFSGRLQALAMSHDLLLQEGWHGASIHEIVRLQLGPYLGREQSQIRFDGPPVLFKPEAAQGLGLAIHELATNAVKYGALSSPIGRVSLIWRRLPASEGYGLEVAWTESGGPTVAKPAHRGFGTLAIERHLAHALDGEVQLTFPPQGVHCRIVVPVSQFVPSR
ncbi:MAG: hypothetical protein QOD74_2231 [Variibacter sp.]|nr:hypothetical protein [Variibacter sp.]